MKLKQNKSFILILVLVSGLTFFGNTKGFSQNSTDYGSLIGWYKSDEQVREEFKENFTNYDKYQELIRKIISPNNALGEDAEDEDIEKEEFTKLAKTIPYDDLIALYAYTDEDYKLLNSALSQENMIELKKFDAQIKCTISALNHFKPFSGIVYRKTSLTKQQFDSYKQKAGTFVKGENKPVNKDAGVIVEKAFTSTTLLSGGNFDGNTIFVITSKNGKRLQFFSKHPYEEEVLFPPGTHFKVNQVFEKFGKDQKPQYLIYLEEIENHEEDEET